MVTADRHAMLAVAVARRVPDFEDAVIQCHKLGVPSDVIRHTLRSRHPQADALSILRIIARHDAPDLYDYFRRFFRDNPTSITVHRVA